MAISDIENKTPTNDEPPSEQEEETRPTHTAEIGTLKKLSVPGGTAWLGSSSGVYFVNTVRRAFSAAFASQSHEGNSDSEGETTVPASEDIITGDDSTGRHYNGTTPNGTAAKGGWWQHDQDIHRRIVTAVGRPPADRRVAMDLVTTFFRQTHPLFPFLHGPKFLEDMNEIYIALNTQPPQSQSSQQKPTASKADRRTNSPTSSTSSTNLSSQGLGTLHTVDPLKLITFQIIINIAALSHPASSQSSLPPSSSINSSSSLLTLVLPLSTTPLLPTIQLLLAAELYLLSTISLRASSSLAGLVLRLIYHAGLHRCPLRYASLTEQDCEIRKRIFWSAYALDRHLSLALGDPNTFQDSDIDVCLSRNGEGEMHRAVAQELLSEKERALEVNLHMPRDKGGRIVNLAAQQSTSDPSKMQSPTSRTSISADVNMDDRPQPAQDAPVITSQNKQLREAALTAYVHYGKLTGRIIEIFHKSINFRFPKEDAIGFLTADIENWWNDLPSTLTGEFNGALATQDEGSPGEAIDPGLVHQHKMLTPFFTILYHQLLLLLNRPRLSLDQATAEFQQGLQVCIRASRSTLSALKKHRENGQSMFLPGLLSAAWMSGLIIAFACQLGKYPKTRACSDIRSCLGLLESMNIKWYTVKNCHKVLSLFLANITGRKASSAGYLAVGRGDAGPSTVPSFQATRKRNRDSISVDNSEAEPSPKRDSLAGISPASSDFRPQHFRSPEMRSTQGFVPRRSNTATASTNLARQDSIASASGMDYQATGPTEQPSHMFPINSGANFDNTRMQDANVRKPNQRIAGAAIYADPQDMAFAQSSHSMGMSLPELSTMDDQMFWSNMDSNLFDVFGAVSWETMTGPAGPMVNPNAWDMSSFATNGMSNTGAENGSGSNVRPYM